MPRLRCLALEPWLGGSHERFLAQWRARSRHELRVVGLPARHWKWRMSAGAWELARLLEREAGPPPDALVVSDFLDLPALLGFLPAAWRDVPTLCYFHENQLGYPLRPGETPAERDAHYGFVNVLSCVRATRVVFNSRYHREEFAGAARALFARLPRPSPAAELERALERSAVVAPGVELEALPLGPGAEPGAPLRLAFNHRWEHDKEPRAFLEAAARARRGGARLELVLLGQRFERQPEGVAALLLELAPALRHDGYARSRAEYAALLGGCDLVVSTARHEYFGLSVCEALAAGCAPLLPRRLSYPELVGPTLAPTGLYDEGELGERLARAASNPAPFRDPAARASVRAAVARFGAEETARALDELVAELVV